LCRCGCSVFDCSSNPSIVPLHWLCQKKKKDGSCYFLIIVI
jgi:hypothetical protein